MNFTAFWAQNQYSETPGFMTVTFKVFFTVIGTSAEDQKAAIFLHQTATHPTAHIVRHFTFSIFFSKHARIRTSVIQ
jgi:hypothetical protein